MKYIALTATLAAAAILSSCAGMAGTPMGAIYANVGTPGQATDNGGSRIGKATATSYLGLVATGDCSIAAAKANGGINTASSVDHHTENILGIITKYTTIVKGN